MGTAQTLLTQGAQTQRTVSIVPWIAGGLVAIVLLVVIWKL